jgi:uncharacterized protein YdbL (DUF1318 family)
MKKVLFAAALAMMTVVLGCVIRTESKIDAHITLDIRHISDQATNVLDFVEGKTDALPGVAPTAAVPAGDGKGKEKAANPGPTSWAVQAIGALNPIQAAYADALKVTTSPLVAEIAGKMRQRNSDIARLKQSGCLGESNRGYVEVRDCDETKDAEKRNAAQKLLSEENKDRKALYNEIARLNSDQGVSVSAVESIYAMERLRRAGAGEMFQLPPAGADLDTVKQSPLGQKLGAKCVAGAWVTVQ